LCVVMLFCDRFFKNFLTQKQLHVRNSTGEQCSSDNSLLLNEFNNDFSNA